MKVKLDKGAYAPKRAHDIDAGLDLFAPHDAYIASDGSAIINTGVHVEIPTGYVGMLKSKSGLNVKYGLLSEGVIDAGYTGSIVVKLYNHGPKPYTVYKGDKITQLVVVPCSLCDVELVDELGKTERNDSGFGSTGR